MKKRLLITLLAVAIVCTMMSFSAIADIQTDAVGEWYLAGGYMDDTYLSAEQLGAFMHLQLHEDGTADNINQKNEAVSGTWRAEGTNIIITFSGSDGIFTMEDGVLSTSFSDGSRMVFSHEVAGMYTPGAILPALSKEDFNGSWDVKWMLNGDKYQSAEFLRYHYGLDTFTVVLENGTLKTDAADYGMVFSDGMLYFSAAGEVQLIIALQDDGMLLYADRANNVAYYCEKQQ